MPARSRITLPLAVAFGVVSLFVARPAGAQDAASTLRGTSATPTSVASPTRSTGPTLEAATVAVRHAATETDVAQRRQRGYGQPFAMMVVGGAALLAGLIIGGDAGTFIAVGGAVVGLIGLYQYLQ